MQSDWPLVRLSDHCVKIGSGATPKGGKEAYLEAGLYRLIRSQNVYNDGFAWQGLAFISEEQARRLEGVAVEAGDVLVNITGDSVARVCTAPAAALPARVNQHVAIIRPRKTSLDADYLRWFLCAPKQQELLLGLASAGATRNALTKAMLEALHVPMPPIQVQKELAAPLVLIEKRIDLLRQANATLESIARALFKSWFMDFDPVRAKAEGREPEGMDAATAALFPAEFEESALGMIPKGWRLGTVRDACAIFDSRRVPLSGKQREEKKGPYPYYGAAALMDYVDEFLFDGVYLLLGEDGSVANSDGTPITQYVWGKFWVNNHAHVLQGANGICTEHLMLALRGTDFTPYVTGAVQAKLNQGNLFRIPLLMPTEIVAQAFSTEVSALYEKVRANAEQAKVLEELRNTLLPRLISGKLRLPEAGMQLEEAVA